MNHAHAGALRLERGTEPPGDSFHFKTAFIALMNAGQDLSQRALARAILPHERVARSRPHVETDVLQRHRSRKSLADAAEANGGNGDFGAQEN